MAESACGMVIVGAGECGARAAFALREEGYSGPVTLIGAEHHLPYERPPLSKDAMAHDGAPLPKTIASREQLFEKAVLLMPGTHVEAIDRAEKAVDLSGGARLHYDKLLLATGSSPRRLAMAEQSSRSVYLRTFDDALAIRPLLGPGRRVAIVGGGFIGLELAAAAVKLGAEATVIEAQSRILMRGVPAEIADIVHAAHEAAGVTVLCGQGLISIRDTADEVTIALANGSAVEADLAVIGIGAVPNTKLAETSGLAVENGIVVDDRLRTADPDIYAAGDCCSFPLPIYGGRRVRLEAWRNAQEQGTLAARNMLGAGEAQSAVPWFWSDQYDLGLQIAGLADEATETVRRDLGDRTLILFHLASDGRLLAASGIGPGNSIARDIRLAEMLIERRAVLRREQLEAADVKLKSLLAA